LKSGDSPGFLVNFYVRRGLRTWPIYYLLIGLLVCASPFLVQRFFWSNLGYTLTYTQGISRLWSGGEFKLTVLLAHTWTLAVEEQFYLIWPVVVGLAGRRWLGWAAFGCVVGSVAARASGIWYESLISQADGLAMGGWLAAWRLNRAVEGAGTGDRRGWFAAVPAVAALVWLCLVTAHVGVGQETGIRTHPGLLVLSFNLFWVAVLELVLRYAGRGVLGVLRLRPLVRLGVISYGLYLYHYPLVLLAHELSSWLRMWTRAAEFRLAAEVLTVPIAVLSWRYIERPILGFKTRFAYGEPRAVCKAERPMKDSEPDRSLRPLVINAPRRLRRTWREHGLRATRGTPFVAKGVGETERNDRDG
jgi:peptidoglycan/LPS O-acetylase OafA/YrhL